MTSKDHLDTYMAEQVRGIKWRRNTPILVVSNLLASGLMLGVFGWFANFYVDTQKHYFELQTNATTDLSENVKEDHREFREEIFALRHDIDCTKVALATCCGDKAHIGNC